MIRRIMCKFRRQPSIIIVEKDSSIAPFAEMFEILLLMEEAI